MTYYTRNCLSYTCILLPDNRIARFYTTEIYYAYFSAMCFYKADILYLSVCLFKPIVISPDLAVIDDCLTSTDYSCGCSGF